MRRLVTSICAALILLAQITVFAGCPCVTDCECPDEARQAEWPSEHDSETSEPHASQHRDGAAVGHHDHSHASRRSESRTESLRNPIATDSGCRCECVPLDLVIADTSSIQRAIRSSRDFEAFFLRFGHEVGVTAYRPVECAVGPPPWAACRESDTPSTSSPQLLPVRRF